MYGYNQQNYSGYGSSYPNSMTTSYGALGQNAGQQPIQSNVFGRSSATSPYANYSNSLMGAYGYGQQTNTASVSAYSAAQQASRGVMDAYATAAALTPSYGLSGLLNNPASAVGYGRNTAAVAGSLGAPGAKAAIPPPYGPSSKAKPSSSAQYTGVGPAAYETAVYAAATSLFQAKAAGTASLWKKPGMGMGGGARGGSQGFGAKRVYQNKDAQQFYCEICKISCAGQLTYKEHLEGQKHKKKEALLKGENSQSLPKNKVSFRCDLCNVTCTGQDTYNAHVRGGKHQKTLTLYKKMGKPIPSCEPTIIPPSDMGGKVPPPPPPPPATNNIPTVGGISTAKRVVGISTVNFVQSAKLNTTGLVDAKKNEVMSAVGTAGKDDPTAQAISAQSEELQALIAAEQSVRPVGEQYIESEKDVNGKLVQYVCKLCDCKFSDPNAKEIHLKGRRHRMQYKLKVDPSLEVEVKPQSGRRGPRYGTGMQMSKNATNAMIGKPAWFGVDRRNWFGNSVPDSRRFDSIEEKHILAKHAVIYPADDFLTTATDIVTNIEATLKRISDHYIAKNSTVAFEGGEPPRLLQGVMRVGLISSQLLLKDDKDIHLVVVCGEIPTLSLLSEVSDLFQSLYQQTSDKEAGLKAEARTENSEVLLTFDGCDLKFHVALTSRAFREDATEGVPLPADSLDREACLLALAQLRHSKWYQARCTYLQSCPHTLRILRDLRSRQPAWRSLTDWMCELLVEKVLSSCPVPLSVSDAFRRVIEAVASGILSPIGPGLPDPCEKEKPDALVSLSAQEREDIMQSAQHCLRLISFNQIYEVLGMELLPDARPSAGDRKRPLSENNVVDEAKKDKKSEEEQKEVPAVKMEI